MKSPIIYLFVIVAFTACKKTDPGSTVKDAVSPVSNNQELVPLSYNLFTKKVELFVEFRPFIKGSESSFAAHVNDLVNFKPYKSGFLKVILKNDQNVYEIIANVPSVPGIFRPVLTPEKEGIYSLTFQFVSREINESFIIDTIKVFSSKEEAGLGVPNPAGSDVIPFLKEQAWKTSFATIEVKPQSYYSVINTSAEIKAQPQSQVLLNAQSAGQVNLLAVIGQKVSRGSLLAIISGAGMENNLSVRINEIRIAYDKSKADYDRTLPLSANQTISQRDFLEIRSRYLQDSVRYNQLVKNISQSGLKITSPIDGIVNQILAKNGEYLETGNPVIQITTGTNFLIEAYVNQSDYNLVPGIFDANFRVPSTGKSYSLNQLNGKKIAGNAFATGSISRIPVSFSISNNGELMPGMFLEAYLLTNKSKNVLVIPLTSIIEEQGQYYVYVQINGESFAKRQVGIANMDGLNSEIPEGLSAGERVVVKGAYQIKLSSMSGALPLHGHTH